MDQVGADKNPALVSVDAGAAMGKGRGGWQQNGEQKP